MEVDGINFDVRVKSVLVEQDNTSSEMGNFKVVREALVLKVLDRCEAQWCAICLQYALQWPLPSVVGVQNSSSGCSYAFARVNGWARCCRNNILAGRKVSSIVGIAVDWFGTPFTRHVAFQRCSWIGYRPS